MRYIAGMGTTPCRRILAIVLAISSSVCVFVAPSDGHGPLDERIAAVTRCIEQQPADATLYVLRGELHRIDGHYAAAERDYETALRLDPRLNVVFLARAQLFFDEHQPTAALEAVDRFLAVESNDATGLVLRANVLGVLGRPRAALSSMDRALDLIESPRPEHYMARARLTTAAFDGEAGLKRALNGLDEGMKRLGCVVSLQLEAVNLETRLGNIEGALARLDALSEQYARKDIMLVRRAEVLESAGRTLEAEALYTEALDLLYEVSVHGGSSAATRQLEARVRSKLRGDDGGAQ